MDIQNDLNASIPILVTDLQHKFIGRHINKSLFSTTSAAYYKYKVFRDGECLYATIKDAD